MPGNKALVIAASCDVRDDLCSAAFEAGIKDVSASDGKNIRDIIPTAEYDVIILSLPLADVFGLDAVSFINRTSDSVQVVLVPSKVYDEVCEKIGGAGCFVIPKNVPRNIAVGAVKTAARLKNGFDEMREETKSLRKTVDEMKLVNRAKCVLIEYLRITEKEAHRQIQKRAMDHRVTLTEAAADILKTYEYRKSDSSYSSQAVEKTLANRS